MNRCSNCRVVMAHLRACPNDNPHLLVLWQDGRMMALKGMKNPCADNETFTLGYTVGELELLEELKHEARSVMPEQEAESERKGTSYQPPSALQLTVMIGKVRLREQMNQDF